jgi:putative transposase
MNRSKFSETQIVGILKMADAGMPVKEICRKAGINEPTYQVWESKYSPCRPVPRDDSRR